MLKFKQYLSESKNTHMEHLEDNILNAGVEGTRDSINFLRSLRDMLAGTAKSKVNVTVKWDGAPAIFAGIDPNDKKFFVAKKGIFNKNPKVYKTNADVDADTSGDLNTKMKLALAELPKLGIKGVVRLFTRYLKILPSVKKYSDPRSEWSGILHTEETLLNQCLRALVRRLHLASKK